MIFEYRKVDCLAFDVNRDHFVVFCVTSSSIENAIMKEKNKLYEVNCTYKCQQILKRKTFIVSILLLTILCM